MSSSPLSDPLSPPALAAFLRGVERRAAVLAELQAGDAAAGDAAVAAAMRQWHATAGTAMGDWAGDFWSLLLAQPQLRSRTPVAIALDATDRLGELGAGPRAALLLRLAGGLDECTAAAALGVAEPVYRLALQRALSRAGDGNSDADLQSWQRLREQVHRRIKTLPADRLLRLSSAREAVLQGRPAAAGGTPPVSGMAGKKGLLLPMLWTLLALCVLAFAATFLPSLKDRIGARRIVPAATELPETPAASHYGAEAGLVSHRDFSLLADPLASQAQDLAFHSWLAAQPEFPVEQFDGVGSASQEADPARRVPELHPADTGPSESDHAPS